MWSEAMTALLPSLGRKEKLLYLLSRCMMEHLQRLLGTLQRALDYVSSFTTYLLGDETHPGAEESRRRGDRGSRCSSHDGEVETAHSGDIPPRRDLEVFEGSLTTETSPANQEIQAAAEIAATESVHKPSKLSIRSEGQETAQRKLSESPQFPADAPETSPTAAVTSSIKQKDVGRPTTTEGLHQWEQEGNSWVGGVQQPRALVEVAGTEQHRHGEAEGPEGKQEEQGQEEETSEERKEKQMGTVWYFGIQQMAPNLTSFVREEQREVEGVVKAMELEEEEEVKLVEGQKLEAGRQQKDEADMGKDLLEDTNMVAAKEGIPQTGRAKMEGDQAEMLKGEAEAGRNNLWEPKEEVGGPRKTECGQEKELGGTLWYEGIQERVPDWPQRQQQGLEDAIKVAKGEQLEFEQGHKEDPEAEGQEAEGWAMAFPHRVLEKEEKEVKIANDQQLVKQEEEEEAEMEENLQEELDISKEEEIQQAVLGTTETEGMLEELDTEDEAGRCHQWEPRETAVTSKGQDGEPKGIAVNTGDQWEELAGAEEAEQPQQREAEEPVRKEVTVGIVGFTGEEWLKEGDQEGKSKRQAEASDLLDKEVLEAARVQANQTEEMDSSRQQEPVMATASMAGPFPVEVTPLDTSHQMERVLLRRKSSIRRAPSTKRQPVETQPETISKAEEVPAQTQTPHRQNPRHSGFGPMHPNMMAELQMRLRKPQ